MSQRRKFNHVDAVARARRARERLGAVEPACAICGEDRPTILEKHHIAGRAYDPATMILCRNHHGLMSDAQKDFPGDPEATDIYLDAMGRMLLNLAELLAILVQKFREFGTYLIELAQTHAETDGAS